MIDFNQPHEQLRASLEWGRAFKEDMTPLPQIEFRPIKDLSDEHLEKLLTYVPEKEVYHKVFVQETEYRRENDISVEQYKD